MARTKVIRNDRKVTYSLILDEDGQAFEGPATLRIDQTMIAAGHEWIEGMKDSPILGADLPFGLIGQRGIVTVDGESWPVFVGTGNTLIRTS